MLMITLDLKKDSYKLERLGKPSRGRDKKQSSTDGRVLSYIVKNSSIFVEV